MTLHLRRFGGGLRAAVALHCSLAQGGVWAGVAEYAVHRAAIANFGNRYRSGDKRAAAEAFQAVWEDTPLSALPRHLQDYIVQRIGLIVAADPALEDDNAGLLTPGRLEGLGQPVLLVQGERSPPVIGAIQTELARRLPQARRVVIEGAAHMVPITHPSPVAAAIAALIG